MSIAFMIFLQAFCKLFNKSEKKVVAFTQDPNLP